LGSGLALVGIATVICDIIMQYLLPNKESYVHEKYQKVARFDNPNDTAGEYLIAGQSYSEASSEPPVDASLNNQELLERR